MKCILALVLAIGLTAASPSTWFQPNHEFVFEYDTVAATGMAMGGKVFSGLRVQADVRVQFQDQPKCVLQIENPRIFHKKAEIHQVKRIPLHELPMEAFVEFTGPEAQELVQLLSKPVIFNYENGLIKDLKMVEGDNEASINIKKGIGHLLQMNLVGQQRLSESDAGIGMKPIARSPTYDAYRIYEHGILGKCVHTYVHVPHVVDGEIVIKKSIDPKTCVGMPLYLKKLIKARDCDLHGCPHTRADPVVADMEVAAIIVKESPQKFLIKSVEAVSKVSYNPREDMAVTTEVSQRLKLKEAKKIGTPITPSGIKPVPEGLKMSLWSAADWEWHKKVFDKATVEDILKQIPQILGTEKEIKLPKLLLQLVTFLRYAPESELKAIYQPYLVSSRFGASTEQKIVKKYLMDILPSIGTVESTRVILKLLDQIPTETLKNWWITSLAHPALAMDTNPEIIDVMLAICKHQKVTSNKDLKADMWLAFSSWMHRVMTENKDGVAHAAKFVEIIRHMMASSQTEFDKIVALRCIGNAGLVEFIPYLQKFMIDQAVPKVLRIHAIVACRLMAQRVPRKVQTLLLPVFMNQNEMPEIRIEAFHQIILTKPKTAFINMIAMAMNTERSLHVAAYVYQFMWSWSQMTAPCHLRMARDFSYAIQFIRPIRSPLTLQFTKNLAAAACPMCKCPWFAKTIIGQLVCKNGAGMNIIPTTKSFIPAGMFLDLAIPIFGKEILAELGVMQDGLQDVLRTILTSGGSLTQERILQLIRDPVANIGAVSQIIKSLAKQLQLPSIKNEDLKALFLAKLYNYDLKIFEFNKETLMKILESPSIISDAVAALASGKAVNVQKTIVLENMVYRIPTLAGVPVTVDAKVAAHAHVQGSIQLKTEPELFTADSVDAADAKIELTPKIMVKVSGHMGASIPYLKAASAIDAYVFVKVPIAAKLTMDSTDKKLRIEIPPMSMEHKLIDVIVEPSSKVYKTISNSVNVIKKPVVIEAPKWAKGVPTPTLVTKEYTVEALGITLVLEHTKPLPTTVSPFRITIRAKPANEKPEKFEIISQCQPNQQPSTVPGAPQLSNGKQTNVFVTVKSEGGARPINAKIQMVWQRTPEGDIQIMHVNVGGLNTVVPALKDEKFCVSTTMKYPQVPEFFVEPLSPNIKIEQITKVLRGSACQSEVIAANIFHKKSESQKSFEASRYTAMPEYRKCQQQKAAGMMATFACTRLMEVLGELRTTEMKVTVQPEILTPQIRSYMGLLHTYVRFILFRSASVEQAENEENSITIVAERENAMINVLVKLPFETIIIPDHFVSTFPLFTPLHVSLPYYKMVWRSLQGEIRKKANVPVSVAEPLTAPQKICVIKPDTITTIDGAKIEEARQAGCEVVVAQDCSTDKKFSVTAKNIEGTSSKAVKAYLGKITVEVDPTSSLPVKVNGEEQVLPVKNSKVVITQLGQRQIEVKCKVTGLRILYEFDRVFVEPSVLYYGKLCGLCGNFNEEAYDDQTRMSKPVSFEDLVASYVAPGSGPECRPKIIKIAGDEQSIGSSGSSITGGISDW